MKWSYVGSESVDVVTPVVHDGYSSMYIVQSMASCAVAYVRVDGEAGSLRFLDCGDSIDDAVTRAEVMHHQLMRYIGKSSPPLPSVTASLDWESVGAGWLFELGAEFEGMIVPTSDGEFEAETRRRLGPVRGVIASKHGFRTAAEAKSWVALTVALLTSVYVEPSPGLAPRLAWRELWVGHRDDDWSAVVVVRGPRWMCSIGREAEDIFVFADFSTRRAAQMWASSAITVARGVVVEPEAPQMSWSTSSTYSGLAIGGLTAEVWCADGYSAVVGRERTAEVAGVALIRSGFGEGARARAWAERALAGVQWLGVLMGRAEVAAARAEGNRADEDRLRWN